MAVLNKMELVKFLIKHHNETRQEEISRIKLQKALYFLFAFYGAQVRILNLDVDFGQKPEFLFEPKFEAWAYGPVDREIYTKFKNNKIDINTFNCDRFLEKIDEYTKDYLIEMTETIFNTGDFTLVDLSHGDNCWKTKFKRDNPQGNELIPGEEIISEYFHKE